MAATSKPTRPKSEAVSPGTDARTVLATLKPMGNARIRDEMKTRYGIVIKDAYGIRMSEMQRVAKQLGRNHELALALWETGNYEARTVAALVADPAQLTPALMDRWCRDFDNWASCDTVCFNLFDQSPHAFGRVVTWVARKGEFQKRAAFALLACLATHYDDAEDDAFMKLLPLAEAAATDARNFVKKGVSWGLRGVGGRSKNLEAEVVGLAGRLVATPDTTARWIGQDVLRALTGRPTP